MKKLAVFSAAALIGVGSFAATDAQAQFRRHGGAVAAGVIGGLAAGALIGAAASNVYAAPAYGYGYGPVGYGYAPVTYGYGGYAPVEYGYSDDGYGYDEAPVATTVVAPSYAPVAYRTHVVRRAYAPVGYYAPRRVYRSARVVRGYGYAPARYGYGSGNPNARNPSRSARQQNLGQTSGGYLR